MMSSFQGTDTLNFKRYHFEENEKKKIKRKISSQDNLK